MHLLGPPGSRCPGEARQTRGLLKVLTHFSCVQLFVTPQTVAHQAHLSIGFSREEYWSELLFPSPGDLPNPEIEPASLVSSEESSLLLEPPGKLLLKVQFSSVMQLCPTLYDPMVCSMPGFPVHHQLTELTQTHVHRVSDAMQPSLSSSVVHFSSCLQSFPASESFPVSQFFVSGDQSIGVSAPASVVPMNIQD